MPYEMLPLQVNDRPLDTATPVRQAQQDQLSNAMSTEQILKAHYEGLDAREKSRLTSTVAGAVQLKAFLDNDDLDGAHDFLLKRKTALHGRMGSGENVDTQETDAALDMLRRGNVDELKSNIQGLMAAGQVYGILGGNDQPSNVQEWQYYNSLPPEDQKRFIEMKRSNQVVNLGGTQKVIGAGGSTIQEFSVTPEPEQMPDFKRQQAQATAEGTGAGETNANATNTLQNMAGTIAAMEALKTSSQNAPSGFFGDVGATVASKSGAGGESARAQGDFTVKRAAAENAIRAAFRVAGSGANSDRDALPFIQMLPDASDADDVKVAKTDAAIQAMKTKVTSLAQQRGIPDPFSGVTTQGTKVLVSNGQETFEIDEADLPAAQAEGFQVQ